jgi:hypothetical protein
MATIERLAAIGNIAGGRRRVAAILEKHVGIVSARRDVDAIARLA